LRRRRIRTIPGAANSNHTIAAYKIVLIAKPGQTGCTGNAPMIVDVLGPIHLFLIAMPPYPPGIHVPMEYTCSHQHERHGHPNVSLKGGFLKLGTFIIVR
jgi:hypothetical protein